MVLNIKRAKKDYTEHIAAYNYYILRAKEEEKTGDLKGLRNKFIDMAAYHKGESICIANRHGLNVER